MTDASSKPSKPRHRWFQFSLRALLIVVTLVAGLLVAWRMYVEPYRRQRETMKLIEELGGKYTLEPADKWLRWLYGDDFQNIVLVDVADCDDPAEYLEQAAALPELKTLLVGGPSFTDAHLLRLGSLGTIRVLVIDSSPVSGTALMRLREISPQLMVHRSQRRAIAAIRKLGRNGHVASRFTPQASFGATIDRKHFEIAIEVFLVATDAHLQYVAALSNLESLSVPSNHVTNTGIKHLAGLTKLRLLYLGGENITDAGLSHLKGLKALNTLSLGTLSLGTQVTDAGLKELKDLKALTHLDLRFTQVTDAGLAHLKALTNLQWLSLAVNQVSDAGVNDLQKALPNCKIYRYR